MKRFLWILLAPAALLAQAPRPPVTNFLGLTDTPDTYSGQAGKVVTVNPAATGLEFGAAGGGSGTVTSITATTPIIVTPTPLIATGVISLDATKLSNWDTAFTDRLKWDGGATGLTAATGRISLGLEIGVNVQAFDADLTTWAGITPSANFQTMVPHTFAQMRTDLGLVIGTNVQAWDTDLDGWALKAPYAGTLTITSGKTFNVTNTLTLSGTDGSTLNIGTGGTLGTAAYTAASAYQPIDTDLTTIAGLTATTDNFIIGVSSAWASRTAAQARTTLGLVIGTNVQAWDADLDALAGIAGVQGDIIYRNASTWVRLAPGTDGNQLTTHGASANPTWDSASAGGGGNAFGTIAVSGQTSVVADAAPDTLTLVAGTNVTITTDAGAADSVTINATGGGGGTPGGSDTYVQYNDVGVFGGDSGLTFNETTNALTVSSNVSVGPAPSAAIQAIAPNAAFYGSLVTPGVGAAFENTTASSATQGSLFHLYENDGTAMTSGDRLGGFIFGGSSSASAIRNTASITGYASETWTDGVGYGTRLRFDIMANGTTTRAEQFAIENNGLLSIGGSSDLGIYRNAAGTLEINNGTAGQYRDLKVRDLYTTSTTTPSVRIGDAGSGIGYNGGGTMQFMMGGAVYATLATTSFSVTGGYQIGGAAASGKILKGNGTNFVASTETYAAPGTSGNVMTSDGTNWTSAASAGGNVSNSGTPTADQLPIWVTATTIKGVTGVAGGTAGQVLKKNSSTDYDWAWAADVGGAGSGDVVGPASATDNAIARFDTTTGKLIQDSVITIADTTGAFSNAGTAPSITATGAATDINIQISPKGTGDTTFSSAIVPGGGSLGTKSIGILNHGGLRFDSNSVRMGRFTASAAIFVAGINLGWTSDTGDPTISADLSFSRAAAGLVEINNGTDGQYRDLIARDITARLKPRVTTSATGNTTPTPSADTDDQYVATGMTVNMVFGAPTGTPVDGQKLIIRIKDSGSVRTLGWNAAYRIIGTTLPTTTVASKTIYVGCIWNGVDSKWDVVAVSSEA
jgi:hypothetical protein